MSDEYRAVNKNNTIIKIYILLPVEYAREASNNALKKKYKLNWVEKEQYIYTVYMRLKFIWVQI